MHRVLFLFLMGSLSFHVAANTVFTYQGQLNDGTEPFDGTVAMEFRLFDSGSGGSQIGNTIDGPVDVSAGLFQVELDFGNQAYEGFIWLEITVDGEALDPRQRITAAPLAIRSLDGGSLWNEEAQGIFYLGDRVAIGQATSVGPQRLAVRSASGQDPLSVSNAGGLRALHVQEDTGVAIGSFFVAPAGGLVVGGKGWFTEDVEMEGQLGIGTDSPVGPLHIEGATGPILRIYDNRSVLIGGGSGPLAGPGDLSVSGRLQVLDTPSGGSLTLCIVNSPVPSAIGFCGSSQRFKQDIEPLDSASEIVDRLEAVSFRWIDSGQADIGLVAEQVAEVEPRLATVDEQGEVQGVNYRHLTAVLVRALQEQKQESEAQVAALQEELLQVRALAGRAQAAEDRLAVLESLILGETVAVRTAVE